MRQVDEFAIATPDQRTADILMDLLDDQLTIPIKRQGLLEMFNGVDVVQTKHYIKLDCHTYIEKFSAKYLATWMNKIPLSDNRPNPSQAMQTGSETSMLRSVQTTRKNLPPSRNPCK